MTVDISLSQYLQNNAKSFQFCTSADEIPGCVDVVNMELRQLLGSNDEIILDDQHIMQTLNVINSVIKKAKDIKNQFLSQEDVINKLRQNLQIKTQQLEAQKDSYEQEINKLMQTFLQFQVNEKHMSKQLSQQSHDLQKMISNYDDVVRKYDIAEKTRKRIVQENQLLSDRLSDALRQKPVDSFQTKKVNIKLLEDTIHDLYKDIYQVNLEKNLNFDSNLQVLAEAVAHVQKTYNEDMNNSNNQIALLNRRIIDLEMKLRKHDK